MSRLQDWLLLAEAERTGFMSFNYDDEKEALLPSADPQISHVTHFFDNVNTR